MEPIVGALYGVESALEAGVALAKGILHPTLPLRATLSRITGGPNLPRTGHTLSIIKGRAYIYGGESSDAAAADTDVHVIVLPTTDVEETDYFTVTPKGPNPGPRKNHTATVVGDDIYVFGGQPLSSPSSSGSTEPDPPGRVWAFSTISSTWRPAPDSPGPAPRTGHAAAGTEDPNPQAPRGWIRAPPDPADDRMLAEPEPEGSFGTVFVVGGRKIVEVGKEGEGEQLDDAWAFDIRTARWTQLPSLPRQLVKAELGAVVVGTRLYVVSGGVVEYLDIRRVIEFAAQGNQPTSPEQASLLGEWQIIETDTADGKAPGPDDGTGVVDVTTGQGRRYLLLLAGGEVSEDGTGAEAGRAKDTIFALQLPPEPESAAALKDSMRETIKKDTKKHAWAEVEYKYTDERGDVVSGDKASVQQLSIGARKGAAVAKGSEVDGATVVLWGGMDDEGKVMSDGWMVTVDR
ncbi:hypothetical protein H2199_002926 [Coniosporium tulheliwenetii]|uniref:Uncharacterized protein n=1 Tax=Coniosporium tulheliwenetii TaxID=3383036 RepID=A0ACC2ZDR6_9PEZI|nr:hypothetical protein H2199_002926 [Cladosporium sp. JES 115]